jgi:hypothetical protein
MSTIQPLSCRKILAEVCSQKVEDDGLTILRDAIRMAFFSTDASMLVHYQLNHRLSCDKYFQFLRKLSSMVRAVSS